MSNMSEKSTPVVSGTFELTCTPQGCPKVTFSVRFKLDADTVVVTTENGEKWVARFAKNFESATLWIPEANIPNFARIAQMWQRTCIAVKDCPENETLFRPLWKAKGIAELFIVAQILTDLACSDHLSSFNIDYLHFSVRTYAELLQKIRRTVDLRSYEEIQALLKLAMSIYGAAECVIRHAQAEDLSQIFGLIDRFFGIIPSFGANDGLCGAFRRKSDGKLAYLPTPVLRLEPSNSDMHDLFIDGHWISISKDVLRCDYAFEGAGMKESAAATDSEFSHSRTMI